MQSPIFAYNEQQTQEHWSLQNSQMLRVLAQQYEAATPAVGELIAATQRLLRALTEGDAPSLPHQHTPGRSVPGPAGPVVRQEDCP